MNICFLDTETLGLHPDAPIWEFAAQRRSHDGTVDERHLMIQHDPAGWLDTLDEQFRRDYQARYRRARAVDEATAAEEIHFITNGAVLVICNPVFDEPRLAKLLRRNGIEPSWHYHCLDSSSIAIGYLAARGMLPAPPWKSDALSAAVGVDPAGFDRHTGGGDVAWLAAQWDKTVWPALRSALISDLLAQKCPDCPHEVGRHTPGLGQGSAGLPGCPLCECTNGTPPAIPAHWQNRGGVQ